LNGSGKTSRELGVKRVPTAQVRERKSVDHRSPRRNEASQGEKHRRRKKDGVFTPHRVAPFWLETLTPIACQDKTRRRALERPRLGRARTHRRAAPGPP